MKTNLCLCFGFFPDKLEGIIANNTKAYLQNAANVLQKKFIEGLTYYCEHITVINAPFVGYYGVGYRSLRVPSCYMHQLKNRSDVDIRSFSFNTLPLVSHKERRHKCKNEVRRWLQEHKGEKNVVVVYSVHMDFIGACIDLKKKNDFKVVVIVPDLPRYMNTSTKWYSRLHAKVNKLTAKDRSGELSQIDGFVYLTEQMDGQICHEHRPFIVIEGMASAQEAIVNDASKKEKVILYTGTMAKKYGIMSLVNAYTLMRHKDDYKLCLCGWGDGVSEILKLIGSYNIDYRGEISNQEVLQIQKSATLLVNPRMEEGEYTKYSFPSKIMEYYSSGTPTIMHRLSGIPQEYYKYCFTFNGTTPEVIAADIDTILDNNEEFLEKLGNEAREFVYNQKNPQKQCAKLMKLLDDLYK